MREVEGTQSGITYIRRRHRTVEKCVAVQTIFGVCARETGYEGGGHRMEAWWHQEVPETQLRVTLENISREDRRMQQGKNNTHWEPEGETAGSGKIEFGYSGMEMGNY